MAFFRFSLQKFLKTPFLVSLGKIDDTYFFKTLFITFYNVFYQFLIIYFFMSFYVV